MTVPTPADDSAALDLVPTPVVRLRADGSVCYANPAAAGVVTDLGAVREAARGGVPADVAVPGYRVRVVPEPGGGALAVYAPAAAPRPGAGAGDAGVLFDAFLAAVPALAWLKDGAGRYVYVNPRLEAAFESAAADWVGRTDADLTAPEAAAAIAAHDRQVLETGRPLEVEETVPDPRGVPAQYHTVKFPVDLSSGRHVGGVAVDVTRLREFEDARRKAEWQMLQAQKLESLGVLAGGIAHDFNNLLTGVLGFASLAQMAVPQGGDVANWLGQIEKAATRAADLCKQMLAYAGRGVFVVAVTDVNKLVTEMTQLLSAAVSKVAVMRYNLARHLPAVRCDATQIRQVVMNLITNASDAIGERSGLITVTTGAIDADAKYLREITADHLPAGRYVYIEVSDTGSGMDDATKARIFEPFYTTKFAGRGLGLSAVLGIVRAHHGALKVYTALGKGTTFKVLLPAHDGEPEPAAMAAPGPERFGGGRLALVVDDEEDVRVFARKTLELAGFTVDVAPDGRAGVRAFRARPPAVVLLDLTMPHLNGAGAYREMRHTSADATVILMSGFAAEEATAGFEGKGLAGFLRKPFRAADLLRAVHDAVGPAGRSQWARVNPSRESPPCRSATAPVTCARPRRPRGSAYSPGPRTSTPSPPGGTR